MATTSKPAPKSAKTAVNSERETTFNIFRSYGYLQASLDPLGQYLPA